MRCTILVLVFFLLTAFPAFAEITQEQLREADNILCEMDDKISILRGYVQMAMEGMVQGVTLTSDQKETLKDNYTNEKSELTTLYNQLP